MLAAALLLGVVRRRRRGRAVRGSHADSQQSSEPDGEPPEPDGVADQVRLLGRAGAGAGTVRLRGDLGAGLSDPHGDPVGGASTPSATAEASPTTPPEDADEETAEDADGVPAGVWWLLAALVAGLAIGVPLVLRSRRRQAWQSDFATSQAEATWLTRELLPELRRAGSREQVAGGWAVSSARVGALEDDLTALEATAPDDPDRARARALRDAVRAGSCPGRGPGRARLRREHVGGAGRREQRPRARAPAGRTRVPPIVTCESPRAGDATTARVEEGRAR